MSISKLRAASMLMLFVLAGCSSGANFLAEPGKTTGVVTINSAQVYSRERLLNDRNREEAWLRKVLDASETCQFGLQGGSDIRSLEALVGETSVVTDVTKGKVPRPGTSTNSDGNNQFESQVGKDISTQYLGENAPKLTSTNPETTNAVASPIDNFRDCVAYREEIRAQLIETQLDDRHDLDGKTLYRLQFSPTVLPGHDTDSWAILKVRVKKPNEDISDDLKDALYQRWVQHQREALNERLLGLISAVRKGEVSTKNDLSYIFWFHERMNNECEAVNSISRNDSIIGFGLNPNQILEYLADRRSFWQRYRTDFLNHETEAPPSRVTLVSNSIKSILNTWAGCRKERISSDPLVDPRTDNLDDIISWLLVKHTANYVIHQADLQFGNYLSLGNHCEGGVCRILVNEIPVRINGNQIGYEECGRDVKCPHVNTYTPDVITSDNTSGGVEPRYKGIKEFRTSFITAIEKSAQHLKGTNDHEESDVLVYAVTPKETVQRISDVGGRREISQTMLRLSALLGAASVDSALSHFRDSQLLMHAVRRQPLIVGFTDRHQMYVKKETEWKRRTNAEMGWLLGPSFKLIKDGKGTFGGTEIQYGFRQINKQNSLAAAVAVPSWWPYIDLDIAGCWRASVAQGQDTCNDVSTIIHDAATADEKIKEENTNGTFKPNVRTIRISLPIDETALDRVLGKVDLSGPEIQIPDVVDDLVVGNPGRLLITGNNLWRNTVVTVGSQKADRITILPNMRGLIAEFNEVYPPAGWGANDNTISQPIYVWTSDGQAYAGNATLHGGSVLTGRVGIKSTPVIKDASMVLDVTRNIIPASFSKLELGYRRYDASGLGNWTLLSDPAVYDSQTGAMKVAKVNAKCDACESGSIVEAAAIVTLRPGAPPDYHKTVNTTVFYEQTADAQVKLLADGSDAPGSREFTVAEITGGNNKTIRFSYPVNVDAGFGAFTREGTAFQVYASSATTASQIITMSTPGQATCKLADPTGPLKNQHVCEVTLQGDQAKLATLFSGAKTSEALTFKLKGSGAKPAVSGTLTIKKQ